MSTVDMLNANIKAMSGGILTMSLCIMDTLNVNMETGSDVWLCSWTPVLHHRKKEESWGYFQEKKIHHHHIETVGEISLTILVICGLLPSSFSLHRPRQYMSCRFERFEDSKTRCRTKHFGRKEGFNSRGRSYLPAFVRMFQSSSK